MMNRAQKAVPSMAPHMRRRRFSLKFLLGFVALLCIGLGIQVIGAKRQESAIAAIARVDGYFYYGFQYDGQTFSQSEYPRGPDWFWRRVNLSYVSSVVAVGLNSKPATDETLRQLANLRNLEVLDLTNSRITDRGLKYLSGLTKLTYLRLDGTRTTDAGLAELRNLTNLETLDLCNTDVSERGLSNVHRMRKLKELFVSEGQFPAGAVRSVQRLLPQCRIEIVTKGLDL
jgi:hypothetical protein